MNTADRDTIRAPYVSCKDEVFPPTASAECGACSGRGVLEGVDADYGSTFDCGECDGTGRVQP